MKLFDVLKKIDINENLKEYESIENGVLLDVRTEEEYALGHIPKSKNLPLQVIDKAGKFISNKEDKVFVYCRSGNRSSMAQEMLKNMGYKNVKNIGGIIEYSGAIEC